MDLKKQTLDTLTPDETRILGQKIDIIDNRIDERVYKLYALTKGEISIIKKYLKAKNSGTKP